MFYLKFKDALHHSACSYRDQRRLISKLIYCWLGIDYMAYMWIPDHHTYMGLLESNYKTMDINIAPHPPPLLLKQPSLSWEDFSQDSGMCVWKFLPIEPKER